VTVLAGRTISNWKSVGSWNLAESARLIDVIHFLSFANAQSLCSLLCSTDGIEPQQGKKRVPPGEQLTFNLEHPIECRLLNFTLRLPSAPATACPQHSLCNRSSWEEIDMNDKKEKEAHLSKEAPFLHLGRLRIYGEPREFSSEDETGESGTSRLEDCSVNAKVEEKEQEKGFPTSPDNPSSPDKKAGGLLKEEVTPNGELASSSSSSSGNTVALFLASVLTSPFMPPQSSAPRDLPLVGSQRTLYDQILNTPSSRVHPSPLLVVFAGFSRTM